MKKVCEICGKGFEAKRETARYCSGACKKKAQRVSGTLEGDFSGKNSLSGTESVPVSVPLKVSGTRGDTRRPMNRAGPLVIATTPEREAVLRAKYPNLAAIRKALMNQYIPPFTQEEEARRLVRLAKINTWNGAGGVDFQPQDGPKRVRGQGQVARGGSNEGNHSN